MSHSSRKRGIWSEESHRSAVRAVIIAGKSKKGAAKQYGIPRGTLQRHINKAASGKGVVKVLGRPTLLTREQEEELTHLILDMEARLYGLCTDDVRRIVFLYCEKNNIHNDFNIETKMAGKKWLRLYLQRNSELSIRMPEKTSMQRAVGFNKVKVGIFFNVLEKVLYNSDGTRAVPQTNIYNVDESGYTVCQKPQRIVAKKGKKNVGILTSAERGKNITVVCCVSAHGVYVPPMFIFPRMKMKPKLMDRTPPGSIGAVSKSGWINDSLFTKWFAHFIATVQPKSRPEPTVLLFDGHASHTNNLDVIEMARASNVQLIVFPSHCTHRLQPLDVSVFKSINLYYDKAVATWLRDHPGRIVTEDDIGELFSTAYTQAATMANAVSGYRKAGINPFDPCIFTDEDFIAAEVTERDQQPSDDGTNVVDSHNPGAPSTSSHISFRHMFPVPKQERSSTQRKRKCAHACVITDSPHKKELEAIKKKKDDQAEKVAARKESKVAKARLKEEQPAKKKLTKSSLQESTKKKKADQAEKVAARRESKVAKARLQEEQQAKKNPRKASEKSKKTRTACQPTFSCDEDNVPCTQCQFRYQQIDDPKSDEAWLSCSTCCSWYHMSCAEENGILDDTDFTCVHCVA